MTEMENKKCNKCNDEKSLSDFYKDGRGGYRADCKLCYSKLSYAYIKKSFTVVDKKKKSELNFVSLGQLSNDMLDLMDTVESKQFETTIIPENVDKWCGLVVFGDMHFGDYRQDLDMIMKHTELILEADNVFAIQIGDLLHNQGSANTRSNIQREPPFEYPLHVARKACKNWAVMLKDKLAAFILGNHDERSIKSEMYDFGEEIVDEIEGAYLGYGGLLHIRFNDDLVYVVMLDHAGKGYSHWNPLHAAAKARASIFFDIYAFGHIHMGIHLNDLSIKQGERVGAVKAGGYDRPIHMQYGWKVNPLGFNVPGTPIVLLNPRTKEWMIFRRLERGLMMLKALNGEL